MTPTQSRALTFVAAYIGRNEYAPTYREIAEALGTTPGPAHAVIQELADQGKLIVDARRARGIGLPPAKVCPHCGGEL